MSKITRLYPHYITLALFCQALAFFALFTTDVSAQSNLLNINCPTEINASESATCSISGETTSQINAISGIFLTKNLEISDFTVNSPWENAGTDETFNVISSSVITGEFEIGTFKITPTAENTTGTIEISGLRFRNIDKFAFSAIDPYIEIKINPAPQHPTCASDEELVGNTCLKKCAEDEERVGNICRKKPKTCADDEELVGDTCLKKCAEGEERIDGICQTPPPVCADDEELVGDTCLKKCSEDEERVGEACLKKCAEGEERIDGVCQKEKICKNDEEKIDGECVKKCSENEERTNGVCTEKIVTPTCKADEVLKDNKCVKKDDNTLLIIAIVSASLLAVIIILVVIVIKRSKKEEKEAGSYLSTSSLSSPQSGTTSTYSRQSNYIPNSAPAYDNGSYLARSNAITEVNQTPVANNDPKLQMQMKNPTEGMQRKQAVSSPETVNTTLPDNSIDPRLQIHFATKSEEMVQKTNEAEPIKVSAYRIANQSIPSPSTNQEDQNAVIQAQALPVQPSGPVANQNTSPTPELFNSEPTKPVTLSKPTTPDVFES